MHMNECSFIHFFAGEYPCFILHFVNFITNFVNLKCTDFFYMVDTRCGSRFIFCKNIILFVCTIENNNS